MFGADRGPRRGPDEIPSDELVLAALERAARHRARDSGEVPLWTLLAHLAMPARSAPARRLRERLDELRAAGLLERSQRHGVPMFALTARARKRLRTSAPPELPESPQHRAWRDARTAAGQEIGRFRRDLREQLSEADRLLDASEPAGSDRWFELGQRLQGACWRLASASYCLREWAEPDDGTADIDDYSEPADQLLGEADACASACLAYRPTQRPAVAGAPLNPFARVPPRWGPSSRSGRSRCTDAG